MTVSVFEFREQILVGHNEGKSANKMAKELGISQPSVCKVLRAEGIDISHRKKGRDNPVVRNSELAIQLYNEGKTLQEVADVVGASLSGVYGYFKRKGVEVRTREDLRWKVNHAYFDEVDTEEKAYYLGLMMADGTNRSNDNSIALSLIDR